MFNITFHSFSKKLNSTARPSGAGQTYNCRAKATLDKLRPTIELLVNRTTVPTYNYAVWDTRYYWVSGWRMEGPLWVCDLQIDALATWRDTIGTQSIYVYRSAHSYDLHVPDNLYPITARQRRFNISLPRPFTVSGAATSGAAQGTGIYVLGILNGSGMDYYGFTEAQLSDFMSYLFSPAYYNAILTEFGATEYPEAKTVINPMQYISSARYLPMGISTPSTPRSWAAKCTSVTGIVVGNVLLYSPSALKGVV